MHDDEKHLCIVSKLCTYKIPEQDACHQIYGCISVEVYFVDESSIDESCKEYKCLDFVDYNNHGNDCQDDQNEVISINSDNSNSNDKNTDYTSEI